MRYLILISVECLWADTYLVGGGLKQKGSIEVSTDGGQSGRDSDGTDRNSQQLLSLVYPHTRHTPRPDHPQSPSFTSLGIIDPIKTDHRKESRNGIHYSPP
jgi:hypothetical protein